MINKLGKRVRTSGSANRDGGEGKDGDNTDAANADKDPYANEDLSTYPDWWRINVESFREHGLRPYRPPRFTNETLVPDRIDSLAEEYGVDIRFEVINPQDDGQWTLTVDGEAIERVDRVRRNDGDTVYDLTVDQFERLVRNAATESK
jgi:hypothetical protein